ncbi:MAG TPA: hypothetical protein VFD41_05490 [Actinomycetales bacterium]|nr:hypothetical protein [Actinomycetales bacterium]
MIRVSWWEAVPPAVLAVLGAVVTARGAGLWFDELFTAEVARLPLTEIVSAAVSGEGTATYLGDIPPSYNAPYYLLTHLWLELPFTGSDTSLRLFSLLAAVGGLAAMTRAVARIGGTATGVLAGLAVAANPLVLDQVAQARPYGLVVLATGLAALGLARWLDDEPRGLLLLGLAGAGMGLAHWYAAPVLAGLVIAGLVLRPRGAAALLSVAAAAVLPTVGLVVLNLLNGNGDRNAGHLLDTDGRLSWLAVQAWSGHRWALLTVTLGLAAVALVRAPRLRVIGAAWVGVPLALLTAAELVRPVYFPRYLLPALLGLAVLAAAGAVASRLPRPVALAAAGLLVATTALAGYPLLDRPPREKADEVVAALAEWQEPGEPVVAVDHRAAIGLEHYVRQRHPEMADDLYVPPQDAPDGADRVWLVRNVHRGVIYPTDDDGPLTAAGLSLVEETFFAGSTTTLVVQRWER